MWVDKLVDKGLIISFPLLGLITYVFSRLCINKNIEIHFVKAITIASSIISFAALSIFFNIELFNF